MKTQHWSDDMENKPTHKVILISLPPPPPKKKKKKCDNALLALKSQPISF